MKRIICFTILFIFWSCNNIDYTKFKEFEQKLRIGDNFKEIRLLLIDSELKYFITKIEKEKIIIEIDGPKLSSEVIILEFDCSGILMDKGSYH